MLNKNDIYTIAKSNPKKAVFDKCLNEACRQWCEFIDEASERRDGIGFSDFFMRYLTKNGRNTFKTRKKTDSIPTKEILNRSDELC